MEKEARRPHRSCDSEEERQPLFTLSSPLSAGQGLALHSVAFVVWAPIWARTEAYLTALTFWFCALCLHGVTYWLARPPPTEPPWARVALPTTQNLVLLSVVSLGEEIYWELIVQFEAVVAELENMQNSTPKLRFAPNECQAGLRAQHKRMRLLEAELVRIHHRAVLLDQMGESARELDHLELRDIIANAVHQWRNDPDLQAG